jgi:hypothetical protein
MNIKSLHKYILGATLLLFTVSCSLDEFNPVAVSEETELTTFEGWENYQATCYAGLFGGLISMQYGLVSELGTDLWTFSRNNHGAFQQLMAYEQFDNNVGIINNVWDLAWGSINVCNKTVQLADGFTGDATKIATLVAEARFLRAYYYSVLVAHFGDVPLVLIDEPEKNLNPQRSTVTEIYLQIVEDLKYAVANLDVTPYGGNPQRVTKKAALGMLARVYAQGGGEGMTEDGKTYWVRAKEVADDMIANMSAYGIGWYNDFADVFASANNRNNDEALFIAYGRDPHNQAAWSGYIAGGNTNLYLHYYPKLDDAFTAGADLLKRGVNPGGSNAYYGRCNQQVVAPTKYLIDRFNAPYDKRWEHTFVTAYANYSGTQAIASQGAGVTATPAANVQYKDAMVTIDIEMCRKYGIDSTAHLGKVIYPYADVDVSNLMGLSWQYIPKIWKKGTGIDTLNVGNLVELSNANVHPYPLEPDEDRFFVYLSKENLTPAEKAQRAYLTLNIDELFDLAGDATGSTYKNPSLSNNGLANKGALANLFPAMQKFNHNFEGGWLHSNFQTKIGNIMIMRMAEVYLIAAEAIVNGAAGNIDDYLKPLRERAERNPGDAASMGYGSATLDDVLDEYARELCGEFNRWAVLKRNRAFEDRLQRYNAQAFRYFDKDIHYNRPIPQTFLSQIENATEFGTNGY